jgi:hypothetical protein
MAILSKTYVPLAASGGALGWVQVRADTAPGAFDDVTKGFSFFSQWIDVTTGLAYVCVDQTAGAAVWKNTTPLAPTVQEFSEFQWGLSSAVVGLASPVLGSVGDSIAGNASATTLLTPRDGVLEFVGVRYGAGGVGVPGDVNFLVLGDGVPLSPFNGLDPTNPAFQVSPFPGVGVLAGTLLQAQIFVGPGATVNPPINLVARVRGF